MSSAPACGIEDWGRKVDIVKSFVLLGSVVLSTKDNDKKRIALASSAFRRLKKVVWSNRNVSNRFKLGLYNSLIIPIAMYACECWALKVEHSRRLNVFENDFFRSMIGKRRMDVDLLISEEYSKFVIIMNMIKKRRLNWFGHVNRREDTSMVKRHTRKSFKGKDLVAGRPEKRWTDQVREDFAMPLLAIERMTRDRDRWKECVTMECARTLWGLGMLIKKSVYCSCICERISNWFVSTST